MRTSGTAAAPPQAAPRDKQEAIKMLVESTAKLAMKNALDSRELQGITFTTLTMAADNRIITET